MYDKRVLEINNFHVLIFKRYSSIRKDHLVSVKSIAYEKNQSKNQDFFHTLKTFIVNGPFGDDSSAEYNVEYDRLFCVYVELGKNN